MENNNIDNNIDLDNLMDNESIDTEAADLETTETNEVQENETVEDSLLNNFTDETDEIDLTSEKIAELNKKLPSWSLVPPHSFIK